MSEPKLIIKEESSAKKTRSPPKKARVEQSVPRKKKLKTDADKAAERAQHLRFGKAARLCLRGFSAPCIAIFFPE